MLDIYVIKVFKPQLVPHPLFVDLVIEVENHFKWLRCLKLVVIKSLPNLPDHIPDNCPVWLSKLFILEDIWI